jgi:hypothetical protein
MRARLITLAAVGLCLVHTSSLWAGLYNTAEPPMEPTVSFGQFRNVLNDLRSIAVEQPEGSLRKHSLTRVAELEAKSRAVGLTVEDCVNLSAYLIRLLRYQKAIEVLTPVATRERGNFMVFANLATAYQLTDQGDRAVDALREALKIWPRVWAGWSTAQLDRSHRAELYHLDLLTFRRRAALAQGRGPGGLHLDPLFFEGNRFVSDSGQYEAGELAAAQRAKLPADAVALVEQLLLWLPHDLGLFWQLGELLNATGEVPDAAAVFDDLVFNRRVDAPELRRHRHILNEALAVHKQLRPLMREGQMLWWLAPRATLVGTPGAGPLLSEAGWVGVLNEMKRREQSGGLEVGSLAATGSQPVSAPTPVDWLPERSQVVVVGGIAALIALALVYLQVRAFRHRRPRALTTSKR